MEEELLAIANAERIDRKRYLELCDKQTATIAEKAQMSRHQIEQFYSVSEVTVDLVRLDDRGRYRECVRFSSVFFFNKYQRNQFALSERGVSVTERGDYIRKCKILKDLLRAAGGRVRSAGYVCEFESRTLGAFIDAVELHVQEIGLVP
ncbi:hypothetical protein [Burkholderia cenocepacia]|uniref:hypothetical protein n=1 Tax=Burkholderia cenocepacia TaxID=95486 RepID=UPI000FD64931|nr:hypothetical protein [Burkholderia cenocepacia]